MKQYIDEKGYVELSELKWSYCDEYPLTRIDGDRHNLPGCHCIGLRDPRGATGLFREEDNGRWISYVDLFEVR